MTGFPASVSAAIPMSRKGAVPAHGVSNCRGSFRRAGDMRNDEKPQDIKLDFAVITALYKNS